MKILIRADASQSIGTGHVMRCVAIVRRLLSAEDAAHLVCAPLPGALAQSLTALGVRLHELSALDVADPVRDANATGAVAGQMGGVDLLIVDHYGLDAAWERPMRACARRILVIDDLADRQHDCDFLLDVGLHENPESRYRALVPPHARQFLGPAYALLRPEFDLPQARRPRDGSVSTLLVFFGGTDPLNQAWNVVRALELLAPRRLPSTRFILGWNHPGREDVRRVAASLRHVEVLDATQEMALHMAWADLAIGTCGGASWERCAVALPSLVSVAADNQRDDAVMLHRLGAVENLGPAADVGADRWASAIQAMMDDPSRVRRMSEAACAVVEGRLAASRQLDEALRDGH